jgi:exopolyphosphatase / guanosine-5'-triphosphate,3'-diphosphate pyrophosphatase
MAKITAIIDIGSNSVRMTVFARTSRFGFYLLKEIKSKVRISEGAYSNDGNLQPQAVARAIYALREFLNVAKAYKTTKILCVATSAVRDAPNKSTFISLVKKELSLNIRVIDGTKEAYYGAVSAMNLLFLKDAITVDIGGGSTELALIKGGKIEGLCSLDLGTVRLKELFFDNASSLGEAKKFIAKELEKIPQNFKSKTVIGIGGTNRALADAIMEMDRYPVDAIHGFEIDLSQKRVFFNKLIECKTSKLKDFGIKPERFDVIREGGLIITSVIDHVDANKMVVSGAGVREGVFLCDLLRGQNDRFPPTFNPSIKSLMDRFCDNDSEAAYITKISSVLFDKLKELHNLPKTHKRYLEIAAKLSNIGTKLSFYNHRNYSFSFVLSNLEYGFSHFEKLFISMVVRYHGKRFGYFVNDEYLPFCKENEEAIKWLSMIVTIAETLNSDMSSPKLEFDYTKGVLTIKSSDELYIAQEKLKSVMKGSGLELICVKC